MTDNAAALPHLTAEFFVWLWFASEREGGTMDVGEGVGLIDFWVDERLSFRSPDEDKPRAVLTGENTSTSAEARAALASGKVVRDLQLHLRREEREYSVTLRGAHLDVCENVVLGLGLAADLDLLHAHRGRPHEVHLPRGRRGA